MNCKRYISRTDTRLLFIKKELLEPNRLITAFSPTQYGVSAKTYKLPHSKVPTVAHSRNESPQYSPMSTQCFINKIPEASKTHRVSEYRPFVENTRHLRVERASMNSPYGPNKNRAAPIASVFVSKRPFGDHLASGSRDYISIHRSTGIPQIVSVDKLKDKQKRKLYK